MPALQAARPGIRDRMDGRSGGGASRWQGALVAFEMALAVILVIGAGLMVRTFDRLASIDPGFEGERVLSLAVSLPGTTYPTFDDIRAAAVSQPRFTVLLMGVFSLIALLLAAIGIYGVVAFGVTRRVREIGVRMALGARGGEVVALLLRQGGVMVAVGLAVGAAGALVLSRFLAALLYEVQPTDPLTYVSVVAGFAVVAAVATWIPARRAARIDPVRALKAD